MSEIDPDLPDKPSRSTTKHLVIANNVAAWAMFSAVAFFAPEAVGEVAWPLAFIIVGVIGWYTGTGHLDLRALTNFAKARQPPERRRRGYGYHDPNDMSG